MNEMENMVNEVVEATEVKTGSGFAKALIGGGFALAVIAGVGIVKVLYQKHKAAKDDRTVTFPIDSEAEEVSETNETE